MAISKLIKEYVYDKTTGSASKAVVSESISSQLPGRTDGPADVYRHLLLSAELTRKYGTTYAEKLLGFHETTDIFSAGPSNSGLDKYINAIGVKLGEYVSSAGGTWQDIVYHARKIMESGFGTTNAQQIGQDWQTSTFGGFQILKAPAETAYTLPNGVTLSSLAVSPVASWSVNPVGANGQQIGNQDANWSSPSNNWTHRFNYNGADFALTYGPQPGPAPIVSAPNGVNQVAPTLSVSPSDAANVLGHKFGELPSDLAEILEKLTAGQINAQVDFIDASSNNRYTNPSDNNPDKIVISSDQNGAAVATVTSGFLPAHHQSSAYRSADRYRVSAQRRPHRHDDRSRKPALGPRDRELHGQRQ